MPVTTIASVVMPSTWVESGTAIPIAAKKNNHGVRPRNTVRRTRANRRAGSKRGCANAAW